MQFNAIYSLYKKVCKNELFRKQNIGVDNTLGMDEIT